MRNNSELLFAAWLMALAIVIGAFGAHSVASIAISADIVSSRAARGLQTEGNYLVEIWKTGAHYHQLHSLALVMLALIAPKKFMLAKRAIWLGTIVFAGSLYLMVLTQRPFFGAVTPIGGVLLICGWLLIGYEAARKNSDANPAQ